MSTQFHQPVNRDIFRHDILDRVKLKNRKRAWKQNPESWSKPVLLYKFEGGINA